MPETSLPTALDNTGENPPAVPDTAVEPVPETAEKPSYVKLAMRNMVRKKTLSLFHFSLTTVALLGFLVGLAYLTR